MFDTVAFRNMSLTLWTHYFTQGTIYDKDSKVKASTDGNQIDKYLITHSSLHALKMFQSLSMPNIGF